MKKRMNIEILKRNIEQVIHQPCIANPMMEGCKDIRPDGLSFDGKYIMVKTRPDDMSTMIHLKDKYWEKIVDALPMKYRDHLVTIGHEKWVSYSYVPVFDTDTQEMWDKELDDYLTAKQAWCDRYGCD